MKRKVYWVRIYQPVCLLVLINPIETGSSKGDKETLRVEIPVSMGSVCSLLSIPGILLITKNMNLVWIWNKENTLMVETPFLFLSYTVNILLLYIPINSVR